jgi:DNA primase small subunit
VKTNMRDRWQENRRSSAAKEDVNASRWRQLKQTLESKQKGQALRRCVEEIVFSYTYPRLDMEVMCAISVINGRYHHTQQSC